MQILAISGSLRAASTNTTLLKAAAALAPEDVMFNLYDGLGDLPHFNPDLDKDPPHAAVAEFRFQLGKSAGVIFSSPEYAHGVPGVLKNTLDWLVASGELYAKPVALFSASPRAGYAQASLVETLTVMSARVVPEASIVVPLLGKNLHESEIVAEPDLYSYGPFRPHGICTCNEHPWRMITTRNFLENKKPLEYERCERRRYENAFFAARAEVADCWPHGRVLSFLRCDGALANQRLRIERFPLSLDQQCSGRSQRSRFLEHDGKQSWPGDVIRRTSAARVVVRGRRRSCSDVLPPLRCALVLLLVHGRVDRDGVQIPAKGTAGSLRSHDHGFQPCGHVCGGPHPQGAQDLPRRVHGHRRVHHSQRVRVSEDTKKWQASRTRLSIAYSILPRKLV